jgi:Tol biopolymer transport system component
VRNINSLQVYAMRPDGTGETRITQDLGKRFGVFMSVAPDGTKFVHVIGVFDETNLEVVSSTGSVLGTIPTGLGCHAPPAWSPDGARIAFSHCGASEIGVINADGTGKIFIPNTFTWDQTWTPDGARLVYVDLSGFESHLAIIGVDGSSRTVLTTVPGEGVWNPDVSPDGNQIVFVRQSEASEGETHLYLINVDGTGERLLVGEPGFKWSPRWSPDGRTVVYNQDAPQGIWRVSSSGGTPVALLSEPMGSLAWTR